MYRSILVVCVGNICRSPVGERLLQASLPDLRISSAGIAAVTGHGAETVSAEIAARHGLSLDGHVARQFTPEIGAAHDLILVMEQGHQRFIARAAPALEERCLLFDRWTRAKGIPDPFRRSVAFHEKVFGLIEQAATKWTAHLSG